MLRKVLWNFERFNYSISFSSSNYQFYQFRILISPISGLPNLKVFQSLLPLLNVWKWEGFIKYFGQVLSLLGKSDCGFFTTDFLLRIFCDEFWSHFQLKKIVQCECVQFHLPTLLQTTLVFCYQNCYDPMLRKIVLVIEKNFWNQGWRPRIWKNLEITKLKILFSQ